MSNKQYLNKNWLYSQYIILKKPAREIGNICHCDKRKIFYYLRKFNIPVRNNSESKLITRGLHPYMNKDFLEKEYQDKPTTQIAKELKVCPNTIRVWLHKFGIPIRDIHERRSGKFHWKFNGIEVMGGNGYRLIYCPDHPRLLRKIRKYYVQEHIIVMEKHIGRYLKDNEVVHHKDGNKLNNKIENLQLFQSSNKHISYEMKIRDFAKKLLFGDTITNNRQELLKLFNDYLNEH